MEVLVNADDFGMARTVNDDILATIDHGPVNGVSIVANGYDFEYAASEIAKRPQVRTAVHLNLVEGIALSPRQEIPDLVDADNRLKLTFGSLVTKYYSSSMQQRAFIKHQIRLEFSRQIERYCEVFESPYPLNVDSHQHTHFIPFVADVVLELSERFDIKYIRLITEPFFKRINLKVLHDRLGINLVKLALLNVLSRRLRSKLDDRGIAYCHYFSGVGFSGSMSQPIVEAWLHSLGNVREQEGVFCELLFHPGGVRGLDRQLWQGAGFLDFYVSPKRRLEKDSLLNAGRNGLRP